MIWGVSREEIFLKFRGVHYHLRDMRKEMAGQIDDLNAVIADLKAASSGEVQQLKDALADVATKVATIADLTQKLADAAANTAPDLSGQIADIKAVVDELKSDDPAPSA